MKYYYREWEKRAMSWIDNVRQKAKDFTAAVGKAKTVVVQFWDDDMRRTLEMQLDDAKQGMMFPVGLPHTHNTLGMVGFVEPPVRFDVNSDEGRAIIRRFEEQLAEFNNAHPDEKAQAGFSNTHPAVTL
jgi:hypothetical protein